MNFKKLSPPFLKLIWAFIGEDFLLRFGLGVVFGLAFSMAVILSTVGIMDGFENTLKTGLGRSGGDFYFYSKEKFFELNTKMKKNFTSLNVENYVQILQTEAFVSKDHNSNSRKSMGILLRGISNKSEESETVLGLKLILRPGEIILGKELALKLDTKIGDQVSVLVANNDNSKSRGLPAAIVNFTVSGVVTHGIYPKDLRLAYVQKEEVEKILSSKNKNNLIIIKSPNNNQNDDYFIEKFQDMFSHQFVMRTSWQEFSHLIEAAKVEKVILTLILQIIVIVAVFNVNAFIVFLNEKKSKELFLFRALGVSQKQIFILWSQIIFILWFTSVFFSYFLVRIFNLILHYHPWFKLPGLIYNIERLSINLNGSQYVIVFGVALLWLIFISAFALRKVKKEYLIIGLKKEFA